MHPLMISNGCTNASEVDFRLTTKANGGQGISYRMKPMFDVCPCVNRPTIISPEYWPYEIRMHASIIQVTQEIFEGVGNGLDP